MSTLGDRIRELRKSCKLNQEELSNALNAQFGLNTDRAMISKWETGFQTPVMKTIICLAQFFNVSLDYLNGNKEAPIDNERKITDNDLMFALWGNTNDINKDDLEDVKRYAAFVRERKKGKK